MLKFRKATIEDANLYFAWANDIDVRIQSFSSDIIDYDTHIKWFSSVIINENIFLLVFQNELGLNIGQVRIQILENNQAVIGLSISKEFRGKGYSTEMIRLAVNYFFSIFSVELINAYIKVENIGSKLAFEKAGFEFVSNIIYSNFSSYHYIKRF